MIDEEPIDPYIGQQINIFLSYIRKGIPKKALATLNKIKDESIKYPKVINELLKLFKK